VLVRDKLVKLNDTTKYVELYVEDLRTRVRSPPAPPTCLINKGLRTLIYFQA
jgi:hypothetical protein